ncbi:hypothetical protein Tco_1029971 [Tanacetum coccineum]|uniref:Reverse transcriptase domain-containing protein n=1 Tax=Tanacetum coccineum TaxID=301880 RepID=A0ABQ5G4W1_9ASTR
MDAIYVIIGRINVESDFVESLVNHDTSIVYSSKIDPILEEFADELAHIAPILPGIVEADFDPNDDTYVILREKLLNVHRLISNIESLKVNSTPDRVLESPSSFPISVVDTIIPERERELACTTTHANYSLSEFESFHFDPSFPRPPPEPPDVEILEPENNNFDVLNNDESFDPREGENVVFLNVEEDDSFTFTIRTFLPFVTYPEASPLSCSTGSEDTIFDPGIST